MQIKSYQKEAFHQKNLNYINKFDSNKIENSKLKEMKHILDIFKIEINDSIKSDIPIINESFKKVFYKSLEELINHVSYIENKSYREQQIERIYKWYKDKISSFENLSKIDKKTKSYYYEDHPNIEYSKSSYYEAQNIPKVFESAHRTEEMGLLPPKDRLKEFNYRTISKETKNETKNEIQNDTKDIDNIQTDKQRLLSGSSSIAFRTTNYTASQTTSHFFTPSNEIIKDFRDIKSSYSYYRPQYNLSNLQIEKNTIQAKNRELAEKRNQEEMKEFMNEYSLNKVRFKEEVEKKIETKSLINFYKNELKKTETDDATDSELILKNYNLSIERDQVISNSHVKVDMSNIKNIRPGNKLNINNDEIAVNISLKDNNSGKFDNLKHLKNKCENMPNETIPIAKACDPLYNTRYNYSKMLDVKEIDDAKSEYKTVSNPLSVYDSCNSHILTITSARSKSNKKRPITGYEYVRDNFQNDNLLGQREILSAHKLNDYDKLRNTLIKFNNKTVSFPALKYAFSSTNEEIAYPKYFLPKPTGNILSRIMDETQKQKGRILKK